MRGVSHPKAGLRSVALSLLCFLFLLAATGCLFFRRPEVVFRGVSVNAFGSGGAEVEAAMDVFNPNGYKIGVESLTYHLTVNGADSGGGTVDQAVSLPAKTTTPVRVPITLDFTKIHLHGLDILTKGGIDYVIEGEITFSTPLGTFHRPYRHAGTYSPL